MGTSNYTKDKFCIIEGRNRSIQNRYKQVSGALADRYASGFLFWRLYVYIYFCLKIDTGLTAHGQHAFGGAVLLQRFKAMKKFSETVLDWLAQ